MGECTTSRPMRELVLREAERLVVSVRALNEHIDELNKEKNDLGHDIVLVQGGELSYCIRCHGGEVELEESCGERLAKRVKELLGENKRLRQETLDLHKAGCDESERANRLQAKNERLERDVCYLRWCNKM